ncbi:MAG: RidA family protein [Vulcanimicrobiaceae bacterium]
MTEFIQPAGWARPRGYSNGIVASGRLLFIAGQIGWDEHNTLVSDTFADQAAQALRNVVTVLAAAGGEPAHLVRLTWYVTDKHAYTTALALIGKAYRENIGAHYPAMTLVQVTALLEDRALVEIEATAVLPAD